MNNLYITKVQWKAIIICIIMTSDRLYYVIVLTVRLTGSSQRKFIDYNELLSIWAINKRSSY